MTTPSIPILDLSWSSDPEKKPELLQQLHAALFDIGFLYIKNHGVSQTTITDLTTLLPALFQLPESERASLSKSNGPHFLGYSGFAEETTLGKQDLREQFDFATELPVVYREPGTDGVNGHVGDNLQITKENGNEINGFDGDNDAVAEQEGRDFTKLYWRLRGPNQWPSESSLPGFRRAFIAYHDAVQELSYRFVHLVEEAFGIPTGTFDHFFGRRSSTHTAMKERAKSRTFLPPQHRLKLLKYPPSPSDPSSASAQGVGAHKDSSGWLTFLYQVGDEPGLEVLSNTGDWIPATPIEGTFVVNFGNAFEAATEGAVKATIHRVISPGPRAPTRYSIPFFQGLPLDLTVGEVRKYIPTEVRQLRREKGKIENGVSTFLDPRWDSLGESQLRKWIRSHRDVAQKWYGDDVVQYYTAE